MHVFTVSVSNGNLDVDNAADRNFVLGDIGQNPTRRRVRTSRQEGGSLFQSRYGACNLPGRSISSSTTAIRETVSSRSPAPISLCSSSACISANFVCRHRLKPRHKIRHVLFQGIVNCHRRPPVSLTTVTAWDGSQSRNLMPLCWLLHQNKKEPHHESNPRSRTHSSGNYRVLELKAMVP
jgi:hypothetical protein